MTPNPIRILLVDDHPLLRDSMAGLVADQPDMELVAEASTGVEAIEEFRKYRPDVTLLDLQMAELGGIDAIKTIRDEFREGRIIILTTYKGDAKVLGACNPGLKRIY